jgi:hypothetical protein
MFGWRVDPGVVREGLSFRVAGCSALPGVAALAHLSHSTPYVGNRILHYQPLNR